MARIERAAARKEEEDGGPPKPPEDMNPGQIARPGYGHKNFFDKEILEQSDQRLVMRERKLAAVEARCHHQRRQFHRPRRLEQRRTVSD